MQVVNATNFPSAWIAGVGPSGSAGITVMVKGTFAIAPGLRCVPAATQLPLFEADQFTTVNDNAVTTVESDYVIYKPKTDIVVLGKAYLPAGSLVNYCTATITVGGHTMSLRVLGNRSWQTSGGGYAPTSPAPYVSMPLSFENAFGGADAAAPDADPPAENPVGKGFFAAAANCVGKPLPNLENPANLIGTNPMSHPAPWAPAWYGRGWASRLALAGTQAPGMTTLPSDFNWAFLNGAHPALQVAYLNGTEHCSLTNCTPAGSLAFDLPGVTPHVSISHSQGTIVPDARLDTLVILLDAQIADAEGIAQPWHNAVYQVWRAHAALPAGVTVKELREIRIQ